jgi:hypothetical protein
MVLYCVQKSPPPVSVLSNINPVHTLPPYFFNISFNILPSHPSSLFTSGFQPKFIRINPTCATFIAYLILPDFIYVEGCYLLGAAKDNSH